MASRRERSTRAYPVLQAQDLRDLRIVAGLSVRELAALVGVTPAAVSYWEGGRYGVPRWRVSPVLAAVAPARAAEAQMRHRGGGLLRGCLPPVGGGGVGCR